MRLPLLILRIPTSYKGRAQAHPRSSFPPQKVFESVFAILYCFRYLEAFGSIWVLTVFTILHVFDTEKTNQRTQWPSSPKASKNNYFWTHLEVLLFSLICLFSVKTVQNSENSQYPNASKRFQIAKTVSWSPALCHIVIIPGYTENTKP